MRHGIRVWRRQPGLALAAILSLALGIGANTAIFSVLNAVVLRPLPYPEAERLVVAWETSVDNPTRWVAPATFLDWVRDARSFASLAAFDSYSASLTGRDEPERLRAASASGVFFTTLGVQAEVGRTLIAGDDRAGAEPVAVLTSGLARRLFGEPAAAVGQSLMLEGRAHTVVGVLPAAFSMPMLPEVEIWTSSDRGIPRSFPFPGDITAVRDSHILYVVGRLAEGATAASAHDELSSIMARLAREYPRTNDGLGANVVPLHEQVVGGVRRLVVLLQLAVALMLIIGCANVANLMLGQAATRQAELTTRLALGASRRRLVQQLLAEALVIAIPGGLLGLLLALWGLDALIALAPPALPRVGEIHIDRTVLAFTLAVTAATTLAFGLGPGLVSARGPAADVARRGRGVAGDRSVQRWHQAMAVGELAMALVLLAGAGLLLASFLAAQRVELGFVPEGRIAAELSLAPERYLRLRPGGAPDEARVDTEPRRQLVEAVLARLRATPGVRAAAASLTAPLAGAVNRGFTVDGAPVTPQGPSADFQAITPDYFQTLGIALLRGRAFDNRDREDAPPVLVVNQAMAERYFNGRDPIGAVVSFGDDSHHQVVGVVANARYRNIEQPADPTFYVPLAQNDERWPFLSFMAATDGEAASLAPVIREAMRDADPNQPLARVRTFDDLLAAALAPRRFNTLLVGVFALTALLLAAVGTFGVIAFSVTTRTRELGVRAALGAAPADLRRMALLQGVRLSAAAVVLGVAFAWLTTRAMASLLFDVQATDARVFAAVAVVLTSIALAATWLPARMATRIDPMAALRER